MSKIELINDLTAKFCEVIEWLSTQYSKSDKSEMFWTEISDQVKESKIKQFTDLDDFIKKETQLRSMLNNYDGNGLIVPRLLVYPTLCLLSDYFLINHNEITFIKEKMLEVISNFLESIENDGSETIIYAPIIGFTSDVDKIVLDDSLCIKKITEDDIYLKQDYTILEDKAAISRNKFVIEICTTKQNLIEQHNFAQIGKQINLILKCLKLFKGEKVDIIGYVSYPKKIGSVSLSPGIHNMNHNLTYIYSGSYQLNTIEIELFKEVYTNQIQLNELTECKKNRIEISTQRIIENSVSELRDAFVNLVIVLDSLFGGGGDSIRYKVALRSAFFLAESNIERKQIFDIVSDSYNLRNYIVHGSEFSMEKLTSLSQKLDSIVRKEYFKFCTYFITNRKELSVDTIDSSILLGEKM